LILAKVISLSQLQDNLYSPFIIGISVCSVAQAQQAEKEGPDYLAVSPVFETGSKLRAGPGSGLEMLTEIVHAVRIPVIGISGINLSNLHQFFHAGACGVAVISAVVSAKDIEAATRTMKEQISYLILHS